MKKLHRAFLVLAAGSLSGLALVASAAGTTATHSPQIRHLQVPVEALAVDGSQIAYDAGSSLGKTDNKVLVWNVRTGKTTRVSGKHTAKADSIGPGSGVLQLAIAGSRVAWTINLAGNTEGDDYGFVSPVTKPNERQVATEHRSGDSCSGGPWWANPSCAGTWLGGLVGSGNLIALNRLTTDGNGSVSQGGLYVLNGTRMKQVATGSDTVEAEAADGGRVVVLRSDGTVAVYSSAGKLLLAASPSSADAVALSGHNLVVLTRTRTLELYNSQTGALRKTLSVKGGVKQVPANLDLQGNVAIYTMNAQHPSAISGSVRAVNVLTGKDQDVGNLRGGIGLARIDSAGLVYAGNGFGAHSYGKATLVFVPFVRVAADVG
jgi:hypothetical protein